MTKQTVKVSVVVPLYNKVKHIQRALDSVLAQSFQDFEIIVVDDGSTDETYRKYLQTLPYRTVFRQRNGGVAAAKNTCLRVIAEDQTEVSFLAEDDIEFSPSWWEAYLEAFTATGIEHFSWAPRQDPFGPVARYPRCVNGYLIDETSRVSAQLMTVTPMIIEKVGGMRIMPHKWGHEHVHWQRRIIELGLARFFADVHDSHRFVRLNSFFTSSAVSAAEKLQGGRLNKAAAHDLSKLHWPLDEAGESPSKTETGSSSTKQ